MYFFLLLGCLSLYQPAYAALEILGTPPQISQNIQKRIDYKMRFPAELDDIFLDQVRREAIEAIKPYGYFSPTINVSSDPEDQHIVVDVTLHQLSHIRSIDIEYTDLPNNPDLEALITTISQHYLYSPFNNKTLDQISNEINDEAITMGYNDIIITRGYTSVNRQTHLADVTYLITPNEKNLFGTITYPDNKNTCCFGRYHSIRTGEYYDPEKLKIFQKNMMNSGLYTTSSIKTIPRKDAPHIQDIIVDYTPIKPVQFFLGFGGKANLSEGRITPQAQANIDLNNLGGCGNTINLGLQGSTLGGQFHINALFPKASGIHDFTLFSTKINTEYYRDDDSSDFFRTGTLVQHHYEPFTQQLSLNFLIEDSKLNNRTSYITRLFFPKYRLVSKKQGKYSQFLLKGKAMIGSESVFSDIDFLQIGYTAAFKTQYKKIHASNILSYGKIYSNNFNQYPLSMQYYLGGASSNRGLSYHQINEGETFLLSRNQAQFNVKNNILVGGFFDTGFCYNATTSNDFYPAYGFLATLVTSYGSFECSIGRLVDNTKWVILINVIPGTDIL